MINPRTAIEQDAPQESLSRPIRLSVAAPAYNEAAGIEALVEHWCDVLSGMDQIAVFEVVVCNDGSKDDTGAILDRLSSRRPRVRPIHFAKNQGAAAALNAAIAATRMDWVLLIDSDGQFPIENVTGMLEALRAKGAIAAIGVRKKKDAAFARFGTWASGLVCNIVHGARLRDFNSAFKLVWGPRLRGLHLEAKGLNYSTEITSRLLECRTEFVEVDIQHLPRSTGQSSMKLIRGPVHRLLFVAYLALRQLLLNSQVIVRPG